MNFLNHRIEHYLVQTLARFLCLLPLHFSSWIAKRVGNLFYLCARKRRHIGLDNLNKAYANTLSPKQKGRILKGSFENTALSILELFLVKKIKQNAGQHFQITGESHLTGALSQGKGAILITSHLGSWEYLAFLFYLTKIKCSAIVKSLKNPYLNQEIDLLRRETTVTPIPKKSSIRKVFTELLNNHVVAVLIDQWAGEEGLWVDFFGSPTSTTSLPVRLAKRFHCALVPAYCVRTQSGHYEIQVHPAIAVSEEAENYEARVTELLNENLANHILKYPQQWTWAHRRWKPKPPSLRKWSPAGMPAVP